MISLDLKNTPVSEQTLAALNAVTARLAQKDSTIWGSEAQSEASIRLNWIDLPTSSRELLPELDALAAWAKERSLNHVILAGMGGSSLAPEVIAKTFAKKLTVLDTTDPDQIAAATPTDLTHVVIVVGSKSGSTIETASHKAYFTALLQAAGLSPADHLVIVTDPGSPLDQSARADGLKVINADSNVGGRYSALSAFGLVPATLIGVDVSILLDDAAAASATFTQSNSVAVQLAAALFDANQQNVAFNDAGSLVPGVSDWIEQLIAESTGKLQKGRLPIVIENAQASIAGPALSVAFSSAHASDAAIVVDATLGEHFILWEWVTALLGYSLEVNPFDQPNVTEAKERTGALLEKWRDTSSSAVPTLAASFEDDDLSIFASEPATSAHEALATFFAKDSHYVAIMAYLARGINDEITSAREVIADATGRGTTFGWGPRFLHSTGQFHKGGQHNGAFVQITGESHVDLAIPGKDFSFHTLLMAQALGDGEALTSRGFPVIRIHLKNRERGVVKVLELLRGLRREA
jgi:glucose-6-phosphate isomerase